VPPPPDLDLWLAQLRLPGLMEAENTIAKRWLREKGALYDELAFNVPLGPKIDFGIEMTEDQRKQQDFLYSTKADIVAKLAGRATIIEVKRRLTKSAMGQLAHYGFWYQEQHPDEPAPILRAIAEWSDEGIARSTLANGIDIELYGETP
jgi:hypothetical protein